MKKQHPNIVYINARFLTQAVTGVQRFAIELCLELKKQEIAVQLLSPPTVIQHETAALLDNQIIGTTSGHQWEQITLPAYLRKMGNPVLLNLCNTGPLFYKNSIVTIHDLAFLKHPEWFTFSFRNFYRFLIPRIARKARVIITVSETIKQEIASTLNLSLDQIHVVYNGLPATFFKLGKSKPVEFERPYFLAFGGENPRKNVKRILEAMELLNAPKFDLRIVGRAEKNFNPSKKGDDSYSFKIIRHDDIDDGELKQLYLGATALIYPSLYEGFGLPPLEALLCNCPVLISKIQVFIELYDGFAIFVDPCNSVAIKDGLMQLVNGQYQHTMKNSPESLKDKYSYAKAAQKMLLIVKEINEDIHGA